MNDFADKATCQYCNRETVPPMPFRSFSTCEYHWLGPQGNLYLTDFDAVVAAIKEWTTAHPGAIVRPADKFPMLGWVACAGEGEAEVYQGWVIHLRDFKRGFSVKKRAELQALRASEPTPPDPQQPDYSI
jgi:hypothetical protein